ncbi:MAG: Gx transporter family protein [Defluviitaleaceae bacterium]|nr:Gx transporter family protein [Defluviitaleaceae bacterium]
MAKKIAYFGILGGLAMVAAYIERLFPMPIPVPGVKLGLANVIVVMALYAMGSKAALGISVLRIVAIGLLFGSPFSVAYSLSGGILSYAAMVLAKRVKIFGVVGVSVWGGVFHNIGQIVVAALIVQNAGLFYYAPVLIIAGVLTGVLVGLIAGYALKHTKFLKAPDF